MLTTDELEEGYINVTSSDTPTTSHISAMKSLQKIQELLHETMDSLTNEEALEAITDYLDAILGEYKRTKVCQKKKTMYVLPVRE